MKILENLALSIILYSAFNLMPVFAATSITLSYDATGKLESAVRSDGPRISYAYDAANNFTSVSSNHPTDSDGDKIPDELEVAYGLNISLMDSDSDGTLDYSEVCFDSNCSDYNPYDSIANPTGTDLHANKVDTDGDGYTDSTEIFLGTDPLNANIFPSGIPVDEWYTLLNPGLVGAEVWVVSLSDNNKIRVGDTVITLNRYERGQIPEGILTQGMVISGTGPFDLGGSVSATDVPLSNRLAGTRFVLPQIRKTHLYYLVSPDGDATVQVDVNGVVTPLTLPQGQVVEFNAGYDTTGSALINSDLPILVAHRGDAGSYFTDAAPVPPAALELWGVRTYGAAYLSASEDNTTVNIYADNGSSVSNVVLNAGDRYRINTVGVPGTQGTGSGLRIIADKPVGAIQIADGDGSDETAFFPTSQLGIRFGLPTTTQYVAVVCPIANTTVTLYDGLNPPQSITCSANGLNPGKAYFGSQTNGSNIMAGAYLEADQPVYLMYEDALTNDEHNLFGSP